MTRAAKYEIDQLIEAGVAEFLDQNFYTKLHADFKRHSDTQHQFAGVDVTFNNKHIDEKVKVRDCLNQCQACPSFEVQILNKAQQLQDGWFTQQLSTDIYAFISVYAYTDNENDISASSQISACDVLLVHKQDVIDFVQSACDTRFIDTQDGMSLTKQNMTIDLLKADAELLRENAWTDLVNGKSRRHYKHNKYWLTYSNDLDEQPVNLVITRENLLKLPHTGHAIITRQKVEVLK